MKNKVLGVMSIVTVGIMLFCLTGCGSKNSITESNDNIEFDYSKINIASENIGKNVKYEAILNEDIKPSAYEGVEFTGNTGDLNEFDGKTENINWVILAEDDENYMLTTVKATNDTFRLKGADGYNNAVQAMNAYCAKYYSTVINGKKYVARSINLNDIEAYYKDKTDTWKQETLEYDNYNKTGKEVTRSQYYPALYTMEIGSGMNGNLGTSEMPNGYESYNNSYKSDGSSTTKYLDTYYFAESKEMKDNFSNLEAYNIIFESGNPYWVATRLVTFTRSSLSVNKSYARFGVRIVTGGELKYSALMQSDNGTDITLKDLLAVRPVVVIPKNEIEIQ